MQSRAVVLYSGGLDSTTLLALARADGFDPLALTFRYGQTHAVEVEWAARTARAFGVREHLILPLPLAEIGGSALVGAGPIPDEPRDGAAARGAIPATYVPARNLIFLAVAVAVAEARAIRDIYIGANFLDSSGYPDCRPEFFEAFRRVAALGTKVGVEDARGAEPHFRLRTPLIDLRKSEIIRRGVALGVDYALTISCYAADKDGRACGRCDSCGLRRRGFAEAGIADPTRYGP